MAEIAVSFRATFEAEGLTVSARHKMHDALVEWLRGVIHTSDTGKLHRELEAVAGMPVSEFWLFVLDDQTTSRDDYRYEQALASAKG